MITGPARTALTAFAVAAPAVFTMDWIVLGVARRGYSLRTETISSLSAHNAPGWPLMVAGQLILAIGFAATAVLVLDALGARGALPAVFLGLAAAGSVQCSLARTICFTNDGAWCTPEPRSAYPSAQWLHGIGTGIAFSSLFLACLAFAWVARGEPALRTPARAALGAVAIALPMVLWFLGNAASSWHGFAEKVFLLVLGAWTSYLSYYLGDRVVNVPEMARPSGRSAWMTGNRLPTLRLRRSRE